MGNSEGYVVYLLDNLCPMGAVSSRRMFGGHGLFMNGLMFALVADDQLYLKADMQTQPDFNELSLERFTYMKKDKVCHINYYQAPEACMDDPDELLSWGAKAYQVAVRAS